ncbi:MAG: L,D-transpeptidase [Sphingobacteriales bacterium]|nr:MAG: L,D-transpeptidase [Sphingobacteriales bacterium]
MYLPYVALRKFLAFLFIVGTCALVFCTPSAAFAKALAGAISSDYTYRPLSQHQTHADFAGAIASDDTRMVADWVVQSRDNFGLSFIVIDKANAELFLFDSAGVLRAKTPILLGLGFGDDSPLGIGSQKLSAMKPADQITPAGRFVAGRGLNLAGQDILWIDYDAAISLHRASDRKPGMTAQSRTDRLASPSIADNRASHGCINVSVSFYDDFIRPAFDRVGGIVYVLPETRSARNEFKIPAPS